MRLSKVFQQCTMLFEIWICKNDYRLKIVDFDIRVRCLLTAALNDINSIQLRNSFNPKKYVSKLV